MNLIGHNIYDEMSVKRAIKITPFDVFVLNPSVSDIDRN